MFVGELNVRSSELVGEKEKEMKGRKWGSHVGMHWVVSASPPDPDSPFFPCPAPGGLTSRLYPKRTPALQPPA